MAGVPSLFAGSDENKFKADLYGFVKFEAIYDNSEIVKGDWLLYAKPGNTAEAEQEVFTMNARHTRLGLKIEGPPVGENYKTNAVIEADFGGGFPNSSTPARQPVLRMRLAWMEITNPSWEARFGQDWALISVPHPNTTSLVVGAGLGNLWMQMPQVKFTYKSEHIQAALSFNRPMDGNTKYDGSANGDLDPVGDGERSGLPWLMSRVWYKTSKLQLSASGHYGQELVNDLKAVPHRLKSYSINADAILELGPLALTGKVFYGENLNSFLGGILQGVQRDSSKAYGIVAQGGWGQAVYKVSQNWAITAGIGLDDPLDSDLISGDRKLNQWYYANVGWSPHKNISFILEDEFLSTSYKSKEKGTNNRIQFVTYFRF